MKKLLLTIAGVCAMAIGAKAQIITFNFTGTNPGQNGPWTTTSFIDSNVTLSTGFSLGSGISGNTGNNRFNASFWTTTTLESDAITNGDFLTFTLTAQPGFVMNLNSASISYTLQNSGTGPDFAGVYTSVGGFTAGSAASTPTLNAAGATTPTTFSLAASGFNNLSTITFRIYGWGASSTAGTLSANAFSITGGSTSAVPEPSTYMMLLGGALMMILVVRRKQATI
jgi:hypothetical protein